MLESPPRRIAAEEATTQAVGTQRATQRVVAALALLGALTGPTGTSVATAPTFAFWQDPASEGLLLTHVRVPVWWGIDGDHQPDLLYVSANGLEQLVAGEDGQHTLTALPMAPGVAEDFGPGRATVLALDLDDDGREELLVFGLVAGAVLLDPAATGAAQACLTVNDAPPECCAEACTVSVPPESGLIAALDDRPPIALRHAERRWLLITDPALPKPGATVTLHLHRADAPSDLDTQGLQLTVEGPSVP